MYAMHGRTCFFFLLLLGLTQMAAFHRAKAQEIPGVVTNNNDEDDEEYEETGPYDPNDEPPVYPCLRDPTWRSLSYDECRELTEWYADDEWSRLDRGNTQNWLGHKQDLLARCLDEAFVRAKKQAHHAWTSCDERDKTQHCQVDDPSILAHYFREGQGQLVMIENALTEQEAYGLEALSDCVRQILPKELPFYEAREFGDESIDNDTTFGMYNEQGGNYVTFLQGLLQQYLPGVAASIYSAVQIAYHGGDWEELEFPQPESLGIRTAEYLHYKKTGKLGAHSDEGSVFSISVALSELHDYGGGFFQLETGDALFKVPRRSAIVFFSESDHSITEITNGERKVFVVELWENQDAPVGLPRPTADQFEEHKQSRLSFLSKSQNDAASDEL